MKLEIEVITYERDRLDYFTELMEKAPKRYKRLFKKYKDAPMLSAETEVLNEAGRVAHFHGDVVEMLEKGYRKQSVGEWEYRPGYYTRCSICKKNADEFISGYEYEIDYTPPYCPNCGAIMKDGDE